MVKAEKLNYYKNLEWFKELKQTKKEITRILFVCSGNTCRSPAAEYSFNQMVPYASHTIAFSRGMNVITTLNKINEIRASKRLEPIPSIEIEPETAKVLGIKIGNGLPEDLAKIHTAKQIQEKDIIEASLILTIDKSIRNQLRGNYPKYASKIFTLKGFTNQIESGNLDIGTDEVDLDIVNPFIDRRTRENERITSKNQGQTLDGKGKYYEYIKRYIKIFEEIRTYTRIVVEVVFLLNTQELR
jgi:protein-tyrosine-phosphatase